MHKKILILNLLLLCSVSSSSFSTENVPNNTQNPANTEGNSSSMEREEKWVRSTSKEEKANGNLVIGKREGESSSWSKGVKAEKTQGEPMIGTKSSGLTPDKKSLISPQERKGKERKEEIVSERQKELRVE